MADTRTAMLRLSALVGERTLFENEAYRRLWLGRLLSSTPINAVVDGVKKGVFHPAPIGSWWCSPRFCGYWFSCPFINSERQAAAEENERQ